MSLHLSLRRHAHTHVLSRCISLALQPAAGAQHRCSQTGSLSNHTALPPPNSTQGKIKGRSTKVCVKPVCTWGWRGTRWQRSRAVSDAAFAREKDIHNMGNKKINSVSEPTP